MMGELAASLAHELNQPLTAILSNAEAAQHFLDASLPDLEEVRASLADIVDDDHRASEVIRRLRGLLQKGELERLPLDLNQTIREVVRLVHSDVIIRQVALTLALDPALPPVCGDRVQLQQVVLNLMLNGLEAMTDTGLDERALIVCTKRPDAHTVQVEVQDSDSGLAEVNMDRIFEPFYTTKPADMGMGLLICRSIIEAHGGRLWVANNLARGATFYFTLPVTEETP
jgi:two-component system, LuxR family, sensor kinase FixL